MHTSLSWLAQVRLLQAIFRALQLPHVAVRDFARSSEEATSLQKICVVHRLQQTFPLFISSCIYMITFVLFVDCIAMPQFCSHFQSTTLEFARRCDCCHWLPLAVLCSWVHWPRSWHRKAGQMWVTLIVLHGGMASLQLIAANLKCSRIVGWHCGGWCWVQSSDDLGLLVKRC